MLVHVLEDWNVDIIRTSRKQDSVQEYFIIIIIIKVVLLTNAPITHSGVQRLFNFFEDTLSKPWSIYWRFALS